ncbi:desmocollin 2-like protein [Gadus chalcogrammus]|uniref:desmocollin 2-like protein n=1 Tax=Gadus chalcogrammus TaxID=1042646 RepID=UPI0024C4DA6E|nr:desmocollin 2-like protein [Gadus chalcogrammus]
MAATWHLHIYMLFITMLSVGNAWFLPISIRVFVPETIPTGYEIKVDSLNTTEALQFASSDGNFSVGRGAIFALSSTVVPLTGCRFSVRALDASGNTNVMEVNLLREPSAAPSRLVERRIRRFLKRAKRVWRPPPFNIMENGKGPFPKDLDHIGSNTAMNHSVYYTAEGPGVTMTPVGLLSLSREGKLKVHRAIDREVYPQLEFTARVYKLGTNEETDKPLIVTVIVDDENDNKPEFVGPLLFKVPEASKPGKVVGRVQSTDKDQANTLHTKISYSLLTGGDLFSINAESGFIIVKSDQLDRETLEKHLVTVQIKDMGGSQNGLVNTATATITLEDINDNAPKFTQQSYDTNVDENEEGMLILRIPVEDKDAPKTPNSEAVFRITEGNEDNHFRIETDPVTNEGLLYVAKSLDYEKTKKVDLKIQAQNKAPLEGVTATWLSIPVAVGVNNVDEGPEFRAPNIRLIVKENTPNGTVIGSYVAKDPETSSAGGIKYYKVTDPAGWVTVDVNSGELMVANTIDREAPHVVQGVYNITMRAVDANKKSAVGTVTLVVEDENDNIPMLPSKEMFLCEREGHLGSVVLKAFDPDSSPFGAPFIFNLPQDNDGNWVLTNVNATQATLEQKKELPLGIYSVPVMVTDLQGSGTVQTVKVKLCHCSRGVCVPTSYSIGLGPLGILTLLLPLLLLLLLGILLALFCATKHEKMEMEDAGDTGGILLKSNIEVPGEEVVDSKLLLCPGYDMPGSVKGSMINVGWPGNKSSSTIGTLDNRQHLVQGFRQNTFSKGQFTNSQYGTGQFGQFEETQYMDNNMAVNNLQFSQDESALYQTWATNGIYLEEKLAYLDTDPDAEGAEDVLHPYGFEGVGSLAGSVGCCSDIDHKEDLNFLDTLGPKFKTLASVCTKK